MKIAAWNVNSIRARLPHVLRCLAEFAPDVVLLQETKSTDETFPFDELEAEGYHVVHHGQKSYNGVAIVSRLPLRDVEKGMPQRPDDAQARVIAATVDYRDKPLRVVSVYVPNGQSVESDKYVYKLSWLEDYFKYLTAAQKKYGAVAAGGDYNIAPRDEDIYDPEVWGEDVPASPKERAALRKIIDAGYADSQLLFPQTEQSFSWWDYRRGAFDRNHGLRIDLILLSSSVVGDCVACEPDASPRGWERPSDHAPVIARLR